MFDKIETLSCGVCFGEFSGRKSSDGTAVICPKCVTASEMPVLKKGDSLSEEIISELENGRGEEE